ncbi:MAG: hypothetical protein ABIQ31_05780 [Ferruginibacter sp.]
MGYMIGIVDNSISYFTAPGNAPYELVVLAGTFISTIVLNPANADLISISEVEGDNYFEEARPLAEAENNSITIQTKFDQNTILYITGLTGITQGTVYKK